MSAIFGIIQKNGKPIDPATVAAMQHALGHRAADGNGRWTSENAALGNCRLTITTQQIADNSPYEEGDLVITADANIYNRDDIFSGLGIEKELRASYTESRLILAAYKKWGEDCVDRFDGAFAFAIWNKHLGKLFCAVDHLGARPFYYYDTPDKFVFASEMKAILAVKETRNVFNEAFLIEYFFRESDMTKTYNEEILVLCGGNNLTMERNRSNVRKYWTAEKTGKYNFRKDNDWAECLRALLFRSVENRISTDLPIGIGLSGGLDSSSIACIAGNILEKRNKPLYAFSSVLPADHKGVEIDERKYIDLMGRHVKNIVQTYVEAPGVGPFTDLEKIFSEEETLPNTFFYMDHAISAAARSKGVKVFLSGFGGDFFVSWKGNTAIYTLLNQLNIADAVRLFNKTRRYEKKSVTDLLKTEIIAHTKLYSYLEPKLHKNRINWKYQTTLKDEFVNRFKSKLVLRNDPDQVAFMMAYINSGRLGRLISTYYNRDSYYGMDFTTPMLDKNIMEFMFDVPPQQFRIDGTRRSLLRRAMEGILPPEIQWRNDKLPYSPDYIGRTIKNKQFILSVINSEEMEKAWQYIDKERILDQVDKIKPIAGMGFLSDISGIRIIQGIISAVFIKWLETNGYEFKK